MQLDSEELRLLAQVGLMAARRSDPAAALAIFDAIEQERPEAPIAFIGPAIVHLQAQRYAEAIRCLERGLERVPAGDRAELNAFLAMACRLDGRHDQCERALGMAQGVPLASALQRVGAGARPFQELST